MELRALLECSRRILVFTGAGISVDSGIPDFRSPGGVWTRIDPMVLSRQVFQSGRQGRVDFWRALRMVFAEARKAEPNPAHRAVAELEKRGQVIGVVTQNVDGLHQAAGSDPERVIELHGTAQSASCVACSQQWSIDIVETWFAAGVDAPDCDACGSPVRPDVVAFGDPLPGPSLQRAWGMANHCDLCLVLGSSLQVYPAAEIPEIAKRHGARLGIVNIEPTGLDPEADVCIHAPLATSFVPAVFEP